MAGVRVHPLRIGQGVRLSSSVRLELPPPSMVGLSLLSGSACVLAGLGMPVKEKSWRPCVSCRSDFTLGRVFPCGASGGLVVHFGGWDISIHPLRYLCSGGLYGACGVSMLLVWVPVKTATIYKTKSSL
jgi:hypothetical protein